MGLWVFRAAWVALAAVLLAPLMVGAFTNDNRLCWTPNVEPDLGGYKLYVVTVSGATDAFVATVDVPVASAVTGPVGDPHACLNGDVGVSVGALGLPNAREYYVTASAYNTFGAESLRTAEVSLSPLAHPPAVPANFHRR